MFGKPLISCEIGTGTSYVNIHNSTGIVVPPNDPNMLREAMNSIWDDPDKARAMGIRSEERYWQLFTANKTSGSYESLYRELMQAE